MENKHYIRIDSQGNIIHWFSDAFEQPLEGDICINENGGRHFELNGQINPVYTNMNGIHLYKWDGTNVLQRIQTEIDADIAALPLPAPTSDERIAAMEDMILSMIGVN